MIRKKQIISFLLVLVLAAGAVLPAYAQEQTGTLSGTVTSTGSEDAVTLSLLYQGGTQVVHSVTVTGSSAPYSIEGIAQGLYVLRAEKSGYVTREYDLAVTGGSITQDVKLCVLGDVTGDGRINVGDTAKAYSHVRKTSLLTDAYALSCANMNQDANVNIGDVAKLYALVRNPGSTTIPPIPTNPVEDNKDAAIEIGGTLEFDAEVQAKHLVYYNLYRISGTSLVIRDPYAYVVYNGVTYEAKDGVVTVPELTSDSPNVPVSLAIGNRGTSDKVFSATLVYPQGHQMNPFPLENGVLSTYCEEGNSQGVYYSFTASKAGTLTIRLNDSVDCNITITSNTVEGGTRSVSLSDNSDSTSLSFKMSEGESVTVCIVMNPQNGFSYPEATISTTVRFR